MENTFGPAQEASLQNNSSTFGPQDQSNFGASNAGETFGSQSSVEQGTTTFGPSVPIDVRDAQQVTGQHDLDGLCEVAVEKWAGLPKEGLTAGDAWDNWAQQGKAFQGLTGAQPGDLLYFQPNAGNANSGHAALFEGYSAQGQPLMISATYQGVREDNVDDWSTRVAPLLGFVRP